MKPISKIKLFLQASALLATAQTAQSAVVVNFHDDGSDVIVTFDGTLALNPTLANDTGTSNLSSPLAGVRAARILALDSDYYALSTLGSVTSSFNGVVSATADSTTVNGTFGFISDSLFWGASEIGGGSVGAVSQLAVSAANNSFILRGVSLAGLNLDGLAQNTVLWNSNVSGGDTINFTSSSVAAVPEPSSLLLCSLGGLGLLSARRRR